MSRLTLVGIATVSLLSLLPQAAIAQLNFVAPELPGTAVRQASPGRCALSSGSPLTALLPQTNAGITLKSQPDLFVYVPRNNAQYGEIQVSEAASGAVILTAGLDLPPSVAPGDFQYGPALARVTLTGATLAPDTVYRWQITLVCDSGDRTQDVAVSGLLLRAGEAYLSGLDADVPSALATEPPADALSRYAAAGLWHDLLGQLFDLAAQDPSYSATLSALLSAQGLGAIPPAARVPMPLNAPR